MEKRKSKRTDVDVVFQLHPLAAGQEPAEPFPVKVVNISKDGIAFKSVKKLGLNEKFDTTVRLSDTVSFNSVIEIIRMENLGEEETTYGCRFSGISSENQFKVEVYQILSESNRVS